MVSKIKKLIVASDHAGVKVKNYVLDFMIKNHYDFEDFSPLNNDKDDYPDFAFEVSDAVIRNKTLGVLICGTGIGMSISANKHKGIRAALCRSSLDAELSRAHNDANILVLSGNALKKNINEILKKFLTTTFDKGRHLRRVNKIKLFERRG